MQALANQHTGLLGCTQLGRLLGHVPPDKVMAVCSLLSALLQLAHHNQAAGNSCKLLPCGYGTLVTDKHEHAVRSQV